MSHKTNLPMSTFRAYLVANERLSPASAETYVKHVRRALIATKASETMHPTTDELLAYDVTLSVAMRDSFRAAWGHFVEFARVKENVAIAQAPNKRARHASGAGAPQG
jgi:hypothetical protein